MIQSKIITIIFLAAVSNSFGMELPELQPLFDDSEHAALVNILVQQVQEVLNNPETGLAITDNEIKLVTKPTPISKKRRYECSICQKKVTDLTVHMRTHTNEKPFICDICGYSYSQNSNLKKHTLTHTDKKLFTCNQCNFSCLDNSNLIVHMRIHTGEKPFICDQCGHSFSQSNNLTRHMLNHTNEKAFKCDQCSFSCSQKSHLSIHKRIHKQLPV